MKISIACIGSRGDVQPYIALGVGLRNAGHDVTLSAPSMFAGLIREHGLRALPVSVNPKEIMEQPEFRAAAESNNPIRLIRTMMREGTPLIRRYLDEVRANCADAEAVIGSMICFGAFDTAEARGIPYIQTLLGPSYPTAAFPSVGLSSPRIPLGAWNRATHHLLDQSFWQFFRPIQNAWRKDKLGLAPLPFGGPFGRIRQTSPTVMGYSAHVVPTPPDWPATVHVTGYWFLDPPAEWQPPADLASYLARGPKPVYIGFGSMPERQAGRMSRMVSNAMRLTGQRCVFSGTWIAPDDGAPSDCVFPLDSIPHTWLLPQLAAVVHHGGAGTTAAGLRAGVPSIITPYLADQFFWAERVTKLVVGPRSVSYHSLTAERLAALIRIAVEDRTIRATAADLGERLRAEKGVDQAVAVIQSAILPAR